MKDGFIKVAAGTPNLRVADCLYNAQQIIDLAHQAQKDGVRVLTLPELCLTGYTCGDLFFQPTLLEGARTALGQVVQATADLDMVIALGLPLSVDSKLYNCGVVIHKGVILGAIPKVYLPNYGEFYEQRWFVSGADREGEVTLEGQIVPFGGRMLFPCDSQPNLVIGVELCEDVWASSPPSVALAEGGATLILNLSASDEVVGKAAYRQQLISSHSARLLCGYVYANAGDGESTTDMVFGGHNIIAENGAILAQSRFHNGLLTTEVDVDRLAHERRRMTTFPQTTGAFRRCSFALGQENTGLTRAISCTPFVPQDAGDRAMRCEEILRISALGLKKRLEHTQAKTAVIGLSGGLDSTLAILITTIAMGMLGRPTSDIIAVTMPCFGTTDRTRDNAVELAQELGTTLRRIDLTRSVLGHFQDIGHSPENHDVTYENGQARERTQVLMDIANQTGGLVIGTGDLSELALGWATYNGDHMSMYGVNGSIPKTLVRHLVDFVCGEKKALQPALSIVLADILDTPVSPELLPAVNGQIAQKTEDLVGPYELHDFFLYHIVRWGFPPKKVLRLTEQAFGGQYDRPTILKWLTTFYRRFFAQQFKRSCLPDGPKVGTVTLSPRGDWRMPSDAVSRLWMAELEGLIHLELS